MQQINSKSPDRPDSELVEEAKNGSDQAFELLMRRHSNTIRSLIARFHPDRSMVDDLAQDTFVKAFFKLKLYRGDSPFEFWLKKIAVRVCLDRYRHEKARGNIFQKSAELDDTRIQNTEENSNKASAKQIEAKLLLKEILAKLKPLDRMILVLLYGEGYESKEIARLTGLSQANVKIRAYRIRRKLQKQYAGGLQ